MCFLDCLATEPSVTYLIFYKCMYVCTCMYVLYLCNPFTSSQVYERTYPSILSSNVRLTLLTIARKKERTDLFFSEDFMTWDAVAPFYKIRSIERMLITTIRENKISGLYLDLDSGSSNNMISKSVNGHYLFIRDIELSFIVYSKSWECMHRWQQHM